MERMEKFNEKRYRLIAENSSGKILIMGSAQGELHKYLKGKKIIGLDIISNNNVNVLHNLNTFSYPFGSNGFNTIIAGEIIEHLEHPYMFLKECYRILKDGGNIILTTPNMHGLMYLAGSWDNKGPDKHLFAWNLDLLEALATRIGFTTVKKQTITAYWNRNFILKGISDLIPKLRTHLFMVFRK